MYGRLTHCIVSGIISVSNCNRCNVMVILDVKYKLLGDQSMYVIIKMLRSAEVTSVANLEGDSESRVFSYSLVCFDELLPSSCSTVFTLAVTKSRCFTSHFTDRSSCESQSKLTFPNILKQTTLDNLEETFSRGEILLCS